MRLTLTALAALAAMLVACTNGSVPFCCAPAASVTPAPATNSTPQPAPPPASGVSFGANLKPAKTDIATPLKAFKDQTSVYPAPVDVIVQFKDPFPTDVVSQIETVGSTPMVTPMCDDPAKVASGADDAYYLQFFTDAKAFGRSVYIRPYHEMNIADVHSCNTQGNGPTVIAAWMHLRKLAANVGALNLIWVWCPSAPHDPTGADSYYAGDANVDVVGADWYANDTSGTYLGPVQNGPLTGFLNHYSQKPTMVVETAATQPNQAAYIASLGAWARTMPGLKAVMWWDMPGGSNGAHPGFAWNLGTDGAAAWKAVAGHG